MGKGGGGRGRVWEVQRRPLGRYWEHSGDLEGSGSIPGESWEALGDPGRGFSKVVFVAGKLSIYVYLYLDPSCVLFVVLNFLA